MPGIGSRKNSSPELRLSPLSPRRGESGTWTPGGNDGPKLKFKLAIHLRADTEFSEGLSSTEFEIAAHYGGGRGLYRFRAKDALAKQKFLTKLKEVLGR